MAQKFHSDEAARSMHPARGTSAHHDHVVLFYDDADHLIESVGSTLAAGLLVGDAALVVATPIHARGIERVIAGHGVDLQTVRANERLLVADAADTLSAFMVDDEPDPTRFVRAIGPLIDRTARSDRKVKVFGEMVAVLWEEGNIAAAIQVEDLWNELASGREFSLICGYPMRSFESQADPTHLDDVCQRHSRVIPAESYRALADPGERMRDVARLQQKAGSSEYEREASSHKQAELEHALERLEELDRLRNQFLAMVVHDIRAPVAVIGGFLELLRDNWSALDEDRIEDLLDRGLKQAQQITSLVNDILTVAQLETGEFALESHPFDLAEIVYRAVHGVRDATPHHEFDVSIPRDLPVAHGDETRQVQVLNNLLTNAVKFSPRDSTIHVTVEWQTDDLIVTVRDEGVGIPAGERPKLFRRFSRLQNPGPRTSGTGLGLYISKELVEAQRGRIWVDSAPGEGSAFSFTVPVHDPAS